MLYLFKKEALKEFNYGTAINEDNFYQFYPWDFGPFSAQVYDDLAFFILRGFVQSSISEDVSLPESAAEWEKWLDQSGADDAEEIEEYQEEEFTLTDKGVRFTTPLYKSLSPNQRIHLREFKKRTGAVPLRALLRYVYSKYPEDTSQSKIKDKLLGSSNF